MTTDMINKTVVLLDPASRQSQAASWEGVGQVVTEISELYQVIQERRIDLVLVDESRSDLVRHVAVRVRRYNGLTEIWRLVSGEQHGEVEPDYIDGIIPRESGPRGIREKVAQIHHARRLLSDYGIVARSPRMKAVAQTIERIAPTDVSVLIVGPSGAGKELVAKAVHRNSSRKDKSFVAINCGALAEGVLESELFGHEKGAFTGSVARRFGLFHKADKGTIFLDEVGETHPGMQVKLLRVLEDGAYYPVGSSEAQYADVRIVSATNRDLSEAISERTFREDLYFRLSVVKIVLPPLFERRQDIQPLLMFFWAAKPEMDYTDSALDLLTRYDWPGNVRQLRNFADRMVALKGGAGTVGIDDVELFIDEQRTGARHLPVSTGRTVEEAGQELIYRAILQLGNEVRMLRDLITAHVPSVEEPPVTEPLDTNGGTRNLNMEEMEGVMVEMALKQAGGNRKEAARTLGIGERTLYRKLKKYHLK